MKTRIFKVQRPLSTSTGDGYNQLLIYDEDREIDMIYDASDEEIKQLFPNGEHKVYWKGKVNMNTRQFWFTEMVNKEMWW